MQQRPLSLSIIGWFLVVSGLFGSISILITRNNPIVLRVYEQSPLPLWAHFAFGGVGIVVIAACGYGVLKGLNWSRFVYVGWSVLAFAMSALTISVASLLIMSIAFFLVIVFFLFRPAANAWFTRTAERVA